jgi:hypothetical protein
MNTIERAKAITAVIFHHLNTLDRIQRTDVLFDLPLGEKSAQIPRGVRSLGGFYDQWTLKSFQEMRLKQGLEPVALEATEGYGSLPIVEQEAIAIALWDHLQTQTENIRKGNELDLPELNPAKPRF